MLLSTCSSGLTLNTTLYTNCSTKHHEHRYALLSTHFFLINVVRTEKMAPGIDYVNSSDG